MLEAFLAGAVIAQVPALGVGDLLEGGSAGRSLPGLAGRDVPLYAFYPSRHHPPAKVRAFLDFCIEIAR